VFGREPFDENDYNILDENGELVTSSTWANLHEINPSSVLKISIIHADKWDTGIPDAAPECHSENHSDVAASIKSAGLHLERDRRAYAMSFEKSCDDTSKSALTVWISTTI